MKAIKTLQCPELDIFRIYSALFSLTHRPHVAYGTWVSEESFI